MHELPTQRSFGQHFFLLKVREGETATVIVEAQQNISFVGCFFYFFFFLRSRCCQSWMSRSNNNNQKALSPAILVEHVWRHATLCARR